MVIEAILAIAVFFLALIWLRLLTIGSRLEEQTKAIEHWGKVASDYLHDIKASAADSSANTDSISNEILSLGVRLSEHFPTNEELEKNREP